VVWDLKSSPRDLSLSETVAPTTAEPLGSRTVPVTAPPVTWADTALAKATSKAIAMSRDLIPSLCIFLVSSLYLENFTSGERLRITQNQVVKICASEITIAVPNGELNQSADLTRVFSATYNTDC
jgi:hypothetical protein